MDIPNRTVKEALTGLSGDLRAKISRCFMNIAKSNYTEPTGQDVEKWDIYLTNDEKDSEGNLIEIKHSKWGKSPTQHFDYKIGDNVVAHNFIPNYSKTTNPKTGVAYPTALSFKKEQGSYLEVLGRDASFSSSSSTSSIPNPSGGLDKQLKAVIRGVFNTLYELADSLDKEKTAAWYKDQTADITILFDKGILEG